MEIRIAKEVMMKKKSSKFLLALAVTLLPLSGTAHADIGDWETLINKLNEGGQHSLDNDVSITKLPGSDDDNHPYFSIIDFSPAENVESGKISKDFELNLNGHTINNGSNIDLSKNIDPLIHIEDADGSSGYTGDIGKFKITNGTISDMNSAHITSGAECEFGMGTVQVINNQELKEIAVDFNNNKSVLGGAIFVGSIKDPTGEFLEDRYTFRNSKVDSISGKFTNNSATHFGGAIYNGSAIIDNNGFGIGTRNLDELNSTITITTKGYDEDATVFEGNTAGIAGGALFNMGTANLDATGGEITFKTASDTIYNNGVLNLIGNDENGQINLNGDITDKEISIADFGTAQKFGSEGITNIEGASVALGKGVNIKQKEININSGYLLAEEAGVLDAFITIGENGYADINANSLVKDVVNNGANQENDLALTGGTLKVNIKGDGTTVITGEVINQGTINQGSFGVEREFDEVTGEIYQQGIFTTNLDNLKIADKKIHNYGKLILTGGTNENEITSTGTAGYTPPKEFIGTTIIKGDVTNNAQIKQAIEIQSGKLTTSADNILDAVSNAVNEGLVLTDGTVTKNITGSGTTVINSKGDVVIDDNAVINQDISVKDGTLKTRTEGFKEIKSNTGTVELTGTSELQKSINGNTVISGNITNKGTLENTSVANGGILTTSVDKITGTFKNDGTLNLSGNLNKALSGSGTTKVDSTLSMTRLASVAGTLDLNGGTLDLSNDGAATYNIGSIKDSASTKGGINIDIDFSSGNAVSDKINLTDGSANSAIIISAINATGDVSNFEADILTGTTTGATITLSDAILNEYNKTTAWETKTSAANLTQEAAWGTQFAGKEWEERLIKEISVDGTKIKYSQNSQKQNEKDISAGDTISLLNQATQFTGERKYTTDDATKVHTASADFGTTAKGKFTIKGAKDDTNTSTIDLANHNGFTVGNGTELTLDTVKITGAKAQNGSLINNTQGTVNIKDVTIDTNASDIISNNSALNLTGENTVNSGIIGEGTTNIKSGTSFIDRISQKVVEIFSSAKLDTNSIAATDKINNSGELTIKKDMTNTSSIKGSGTLNVEGNLSNQAEIENKIAVSNGKTLTSSADNIKNTVDNKGTYKVTGGTIAQNVTGSGKTQIVGVVTNNAKIQQGVEIQSGKLTSNADNVDSVNIGNGATYNITGGALKDTITGAGSLLLSSDYTSMALNNFTGDVKIASGKTLTVGENLFNNNTLTLENGSTLSLLGTAGDVVIDKLAIANNDVVNLKFDWGDTLNSSSSNINGTLNVTEINLASTNGTEADYVFTNLGNKVALGNNITLSNVTNETNNFVTYNDAQGKLFSKRRTLAGAVDETQATQTNTYVMTGNESAGGETLTGTLTVQGSGNTIQDGGIIVGDSTDAGVLTLKDTNINGVNVENSAQGALHVNGGSELKIVADTQNVTISGTKGASTSAIYLEKDAADRIAKATIEADGGTIKISDDIMSNDKSNEIVFKGSKNIEFSGKFDPVKATVSMSGAELIRSGQDEDIDWNLNGGTLRYTNDNFLNGGVDHPNSLNFNGGSLDLRNGAVNEISIGGLTLSQSSNLYLDADLANKTMDSFNTTNINTPNASAKLHVAGFNLISDAAEDKTTINFVPEATGLAGFVDYTGSQGISALSPIYRYNVDYDNVTGDFNFSRFAGGGYDSYNPAVLAAPVAAQLGGYLTQLNSYDEAFRNMDMYMLMTKKERQALKLRNKYAAADGNMVYSQAGLYDDKSVWFRPYATFESVPLKNGPKVSNVAYGTFVGGESEMYELSHGWDAMWGAYVGYNGSHQSYDSNSIYQNGGTLGLVAMAYKGDFFTGLTVNAGANAGRASTMYGDEDFTMLMAGIASKTGYNIELADGKFIIQPSFLMSYSFVNTFDYTNAAGVHINSDPLNAIQIEPGIKFIGNLKNGWQPYAGVSMVWNVIDKTKFSANDVSLPEMSIKPFVKYGLGVRKTWGERFTGFLQAYITNGGRNGIGLQAGFSWALGKEPVSTHRKLNSELPERAKTQINLGSAK